MAEMQNTENTKCWKEWRARGTLMAGGNAK